MAYVTVKGTIDKFHNSGTGFTLLENYTTKDGVPASKKWQVFPEDNTHGKLPGDTITVNGTITAGVYSFQGDNGAMAHVATLKVNNAKIVDAPKQDLVDPAQALGATPKTEMPF
jgi:hypothetical protein